MSIELGPVPYEDPVAQLLIEGVQQEYVVRYGGRDEAPSTAVPAARPPANR